MTAAEAALPSEEPVRDEAAQALLASMTGDERVAFAFSLIGSAYQVLSAFPFARAAAEFQQQRDLAYYLNPSIYTRRGAAEDLAQKQKLLDAAAAFVRSVAAVREALPEPS